MADENAGKSVMGNLPSARPPRIGGRRENREGGAAKPRAASATATQARPKRAAAKPKPAAAKTASSKPRAVRSGSPGLEAAKQQRTPPRPTPPKGTELVTTAVQAAGELAQIGLTLGGRAVKRAVKKLPKP